MNGNQGCAQAKPGDPWRPTFAVMQLEKLIVFLCKSYAGYPGFYRLRAHGLLLCFLEHSLGQIVSIMILTGLVYPVSSAPLYRIVQTESFSPPFFLGSNIQDRLLHVK